MPTIVDVDATWVNPSSVAYNASELRLADAAVFAGRGDTYGARGGIVRHSDTSLQVSVDGSDVVTVKAGSVVIPGTAVAGTGVWRAGISSDKTANLAARDATNPRIDLVVFRQLDTDVVGSHGAYTARIEIITGTPAATPAVPSLPSMAIELGRINVPASGGGAASADLTKRQFTAAIGGVLPVPTSSQLPAAAAKWQRAQALDTGRCYEWTGTAWVALTQAQTIALWSGNYGVGSGTPGGVGNTVTITSPGTDAVFLVTFDVVVAGLAGVVNFISLGVDGAAWNDGIRVHSEGTDYVTVSRTIALTGLAAGDHTIGIRSWNNNAGTVQHIGADSTLTAVRVR